MSKSQLKKKTNAKFPMKGDSNYIDRLDEDPIIKTQRYFVISFISPEGIRNTTMRGIKVRYVTDDIDDAKLKADEFRKMDGNKFDVFVGEIGKWLPWNPDRDGVKSQVYAESELNDLMKGYEDNASKAKQVHNARVDDMKAYRNNPHRQDEVKNRMKQKAQARQAAKTLPSLSEEKETKTEQKLEEDIKSHEAMLKAKQVAHQQLTQTFDQTTLKHESLLNIKKELNTEYTALSGETLPDTDEVAEIRQLMSTV